MKSSKIRGIFKKKGQSETSGQFVKTCSTFNKEPGDDRRTIKGLPFLHSSYECSCAAPAWANIPSKTAKKNYFYDMKLLSDVMTATPDEGDKEGLRQYNRFMP